jgi:hypothetical protein
MKKSLERVVFLVTTIMLLVFVFRTELSAYPTGRTGSTLKSGTTGCGNCHSASTVISGAITGPLTVVAGQTYTYTLTITMPSGSGNEGVNIAAKNGTLAIIAGSGLKLASGELTHSSALTYANPKVIQFSYTAPTVAGTDTLFSTVDRGHSGAWRFSPNFGITVQLAAGIIGNEIPVSFNLKQNFPNPFNPTTQITYSIEKSGQVILKVYDVSGKEIADLVNEAQAQGTYSVSFSGENFPSGVYFYKLQSGEKSEVKKMTLIK